MPILFYFFAGPWVLISLFNLFFGGFSNSAVTNLMLWGTDRLVCHVKLMLSESTGAECMLKDIVSF